MFGPRSGEDATPVTITRTDVDRRAEPGLGVTVLWHPDVRRIGARAWLPRRPAGAARLSRSEMMFGGPDDIAPGPLGSRFLSRNPILLEATEEGGLRLDPHGSTLRVRANGVRVTSPVDFGADKVDHGLILELARRIALVVHPLASTAEATVSLPDLIGRSDPMLSLSEQVRRVAPRDVPVLVTGESGVGKELVARSIHDLSPRSHGPWVTVNLAAVPPTLAASELFGTIRGAFTGATDRRGHFGAADGGTLFLDEVGYGPMEVQLSLLRILESGELQRMGARTREKVDVRVIAATDVDLRAAVTEGRFSSALFHRLSGYEISLPPLRHRREDIGMLLLHFLRKELAETGETDRLAQPALEAADPWLPCSLVATLARHQLPGNVRQLANVARQLVIAAGTARSSAAQAPLIRRMLEEIEEIEGTLERESAPEKTDARVDYRSSQQVADEEIEAAPRASGGKIKQTAQVLNLSRTSLYARLGRSTELQAANALDQETIASALRRNAGDIDDAARALNVPRLVLVMRMSRFGMPARDN